MQLPNLMNTLSEVMNRLQEKGMGDDFTKAKKGFSLDGKKWYKPKVLCIVKVYRFGELKDPGDLSVLYLVQTNDGRMGYILDAYGVFNNNTMEFNNALRLIPERKPEEQFLFTL